VRPDDLPDKKQLRKQLGLDEDKPVVFAPISGPAKERAYFTGILRKIFNSFPDDYQVVLSLGYPNASTEPTVNGNVITYGWVPNRFEYLKACDVVVSRGGHGTMSQSICYGKPSLIIPTPNHTEQYNNAKKAVKLGVAKIIDQEALNNGVLVDAVKAVLEKSSLQDNAKCLQDEVLKCDGLETAIKIIYDVA
jgi:UDP:flavonoid glycosyltransferase YjiC (YdhE family)